MKRFSSIVVLFLVLLFTVPVNVFSLTEPWDYSDNEKPDGDDHPWGGDSIDDPDPSADDKNGLTYFFTTSFDAAIFTLEVYFFKFEFTGSYKSRSTKSVYTTYQERDDDIVTANTFNKR